MGNRLFTSEDLIRRKPASDRGKDRRLIDTSVGFFKQNVPEIGWSKLAPNPDRHNVEIEKAHSYNDECKRQHITEEMNPSIPWRSVVGQIDAVVEFYKRPKNGLNSRTQGHHATDQLCNVKPGG